MLAVGLALPVFAQTKILLNLDPTGVAIQGYDPAAFLPTIRRSRGIAGSWPKRDGAICFFTRKEHRALFLADPAKYEPCFGRYCAYGVSRNRLVEIDAQKSLISSRALFWTR